MCRFIFCHSASMMNVNNVNRLALTLCLNGYVLWYSEFIGYLTHDLGDSG